MCSAGANGGKAPGSGFVVQLQEAKLNGSGGIDFHGQIRAYGYFTEICFRFNNRKNEFLFRDTMLKLIGSPNFEYKHLTAKVQDAA